MGIDQIKDERFLDIVIGAYNRSIYSDFDTFCQSIRTIHIADMDLHSLKGIELFAHCRYLNCSNNRLTDLDVQALTDLQYLKCHNNYLSKLDLKKQINLVGVSCYGNEPGFTIVVHKLTDIISRETNERDGGRGIVLEKDSQTVIKAVQSKKR